MTHALDYAAISSSVKTFVEASSFQLLEALIEAVAEQLLDIAAVEKVKRGSESSCSSRCRGGYLDRADKAVIAALFV